MSLGTFNIESWPWKIAVVAALIGMREFIRLLSPKDKSAEGSETSKWLVETIDSAAIAIGLVLFIIQPFILQAFFIPSGSMEDTLRIQDRLLVSKLVYKLRAPSFQDVIVFRAPEAALLSSNSPEGTDYIKRCMGVPGDVTYMIDRQIFHNGKAISEPYTKWSESAAGTPVRSPDERISDMNNGQRYTYDMKIVGDAVYSREYSGSEKGLWRQNGIPVSDQEEIEKAPPGKVPPGKYLFLGDHRSNSNDGHVWGFTPAANLRGKAICVFWPPTRLGLVDRMSFYPRKN